MTAQPLDPKPVARPRQDFSADGWRAEAACRDLDTNLFFPAGEVGDEAVAQANAAKAVCADCPVADRCLDFALRTNQPEGVFGGTTPAERRSIRRRRSRPERRAS